MSFSDLDVKALYNGNGVTTNFAIPYQVMVDDSAETVVYKRNTTTGVETLQVEGALQDYTLTGASPPTTPFDTTVVFNTAPTSLQQVLIIRVLPLTQILDMTDSQAVPLTSIELALDRLVGMIQQLDEKLDRSPSYPKSSNESQPVLPEPVASGLLGFDSSADNLDVFTIADLAEALDTGNLYTDHDDVIANNTATPTSVTDMVFLSASYKTVVIDYTIKRRTSTTSYNATGKLVLEYDERIAAWLTPTDVDYTDGHGVNWSITAAGQVQYTSDSMAGASYVSVFTWRVNRAWSADS